jgi:ABC-type bacteriocin/lantibiotic exporter with double-glycine peptidase domain
MVLACVSLPAIDQKYQETMESSTKKEKILTENLTKNETLASLILEDSIRTTVNSATQTEQRQTLADENLGQSTPSIKPSTTLIQFTRKR